MALTFADQVGFFQNIVLIAGVPTVRRLDVPRVGSGAERVATFIDKIMPALMDPLTAKEKEVGLYTPPSPPRIIFTGTLDDAQTFFQQTTPIANCGNCPIAKMTDGLPIIIPTEQKVKEMMTGTTHKADEKIGVYSNNNTAKGKIVRSRDVYTFAQGYYGTVELVAVCAVMAGAKPEYLPGCLAVASQGGGSTNCPGTSGASSYAFVVNGPYAKEIGMNARQQAFDVGNPPNMVISRVSSIITVNFGQCITGTIRTDSGNPFHNWAFAEDEENLPEGWESLGEDQNYNRKDSVLTKVGIHEGATVQEYAPSSFRGLIADGYGGMARRMGVEGVPGPHNFLEYLMPIYLTASPNGLLASRVLIMHPNMAKSLKDYGFKTKAAVYDWIANTYKVPARLVKNSGWFEFGRSGGETLFTMPDGKRVRWLDVPDDMMVQAFGTTARSNCIIVSIANADEMCWTLFGSRGSTVSIDGWR